MFSTKSTSAIINPILILIVLVNHGSVSINENLCPIFLLNGILSLCTYVSFPYIYACHVVSPFVTDHHHAGKPLILPIMTTVSGHSRIPEDFNCVIQNHPSTSNIAVPIIDSFQFPGNIGISVKHVVLVID